MDKKNLLDLNLQYFADNTDSIISRSDAEALIPEEVAREIIQGTTEQSAIMQLATRAPDMTRKERRMPVLSSLPMAYFVDGEAPDGGLKQTTQMKWENKFLEAEEIAAIVPIPEAVLDDADYDIWGEVRPRIEEAMGVLFDRAVLFGETAPASWPTNILDGATDAGNAVALGTNDDIYDDIMGVDGLIAGVEEDGFMVSGFVSQMGMRARLRGLRDAQGQPLFNATMQEGTRYQLDGEPVIFPRNGSIVKDDPALMFAGDWSKLIYAMRQDITYKVLDQAVITDAENNIVYNLAQQDMVALRVVMRLAWQLPNPINRLKEDESERYPFAVLTDANSGD